MISLQEYKTSQSFQFSCSNRTVEDYCQVPNYASYALHLADGLALDKHFDSPNRRPGAPSLFVDGALSLGGGVAEPTAKQAPA